MPVPAVARLADARHAKRSTLSGCSKVSRKCNDFDQVSELIFRFYGNGNVAVAYRKYVEARTTDLVDDWWPAIKAVARGLLASETLSGEQIGEIILEARRRDIARRGRLKAAT